MKLIDKLIFLEKAYGFTHKEFANRFNIKLKLLLDWLNKKKEPTKADLIYLCKEVNVDIDDFFLDSSTLDHNSLDKNEHMCKVIEHIVNDNDVIYEDYPKEDNARFEEKD